MLTEHTGRVTPAETQEVIAHMQGMYARAVEHEQTWLAMALALGSESLADNIESLDAWAEDDAAG